MTKNGSRVLLIEIFQQFMIAIFSRRSKIIMENAIKISSFVSDYRKQVDGRLSRICWGCLQRLDILLRNISDRGFRAHNSNCIPVYQILT